MYPREALSPILEMGTPKQGGYLNSREMPSEVKKGLMRNSLFLVPPWCSLCLFVVSGGRVWVRVLFPP